MSEINHFKIFIMYNDDMTAGVDYLYVKRIYLVNFSYIVIDDVKSESQTINTHHSLNTGMKIIWLGSTMSILRCCSRNNLLFRVKSG
jgi:hypothetical protein